MIQRSILLAIALAALAACSSTSNVKGTGSGTDDYKASPCACAFKPVPVLPVLPS
jgi:uncharacterized lipoprotein